MESPPERVYLLTRNENIYEPDSRHQPVAVRIGDGLLTWPVDGIERLNGDLVVYGRRYRFEKSANRWTGDQHGEELIHAFRYPVGWRVLAETTPGNLAFLPRHPWPLDRDTCWRLASQLVCEALAAGIEKKAVLVWQDGDAFSDPVAVLDGRNHTAQEARVGIASKEWLPWDIDRDKEAEGGGAPSARSETHARETDQDHSTTDNGGGQAGTVALVVQYVGMAPRPKETAMSGRLIEFYRDGQRVEPPAHSIAEVRIWCEANGYEADWPTWRVVGKMVEGVHGQTRHEVYRLNGKVQAGERTPAERVDADSLATLARQAGCAAPRITDEDRERLMRLGRERDSGFAWDPVCDSFYRQSASPWQLVWSRG